MQKRKRASPGTVYSKPCCICGVEMVKPRQRCLAQWAAQTTCSLDCQMEERSVNARSQVRKVCSMCKRELPVEAFHVLANGIPQSPCNDCKTVRARVSYRVRQARGIKKKSGGSVVRDPLKMKARAAVSAAVRSGKLIPQPCKTCGAKGQAHHRDYSKPLDVEWLCVRHHGIAHWKHVSTPVLLDAVEQLEKMAAR